MTPVVNRIPLNVTLALVMVFVLVLPVVRMRVMGIMVVKKVLAILKQRPLEVSWKGQQETAITDRVTGSVRQAEPLVCLDVLLLGH